MGSPVVIDDGGSTRIKQIKNHARMDDLMGKVVDGVEVFEDRAADKFVKDGRFSCELEVRYHDWNDAETHLVPTGGLDLLEDDEVTITSRNGQIATISFTPDFYLVITLTAIDGTAPPIVDTKKDGKLRRYVVTNAGPIQTVSVTRRSGVLLEPTIFTNEVERTALNLDPDPKSMYTMAFFSIKRAQ